jgi:predicted hydrocarbon binding protein
VPLEGISQAVIDAYPDVVATVIDFEGTLAADAQRTVLAALGERVGAMIFQRRYSSMSFPASIPQAMELVVVPAVSPFAIADAQGNRLDVLVCPFCRNRPSESVRCHFLAGFIQGLLKSVPGLGEVAVTETICRARGEDTCTFEAVAKRG